MESVAFGTELVLETMRDNGFVVSTMTIAGGATHSDLWLQIHADVSGLPLVLTRVADAPSLGSAMLAAVATGHYDDMAAAASEMVHVDRVIEPDPELHQRYRPYYQAYKQLYPALAGIGL